MDDRSDLAESFASIDPEFRQRAKDLASLFDARNVAVVGASNNPRKASHHVIHTMLEEGFIGNIYPVHPSEDTVLGLTSFASLGDIDEPVDLVVISVPTPIVLPLVKEAAARGDVSNVVILTAGFGETAVAENVALEREIVEVGRAAGMRIVGPNCIGVINTRTKLCTGFAPGLTLAAGGVGFISQSGALGGAFLMSCASQPAPLGFSKFGHVGNMSDVDVLELLLYLADDEETRAISMYMEGVRDGRLLMQVALEVTRTKPVFALKVGRTELGSHAALSHTGALAGSDRIYDAALRQAGIERVASLVDLVAVSKAAAYLPSPTGRRVCVLTQAGGPGIIAMDETAQTDYLQLAALHASTQDDLMEILPPMAMICKPNGYIDMTAAALEEMHIRSLETVLKDPSVDSVVLITLPPTFLPAIDLARAIAPTLRAASKPVVTCLMHGDAMDEARSHLEAQGVPTFDTPDLAVRALTHLTRATLGTSANKEDSR